MKNVKLTQAFTIIELMVVISIILILTGLIVGAGTRLKIEAKKTKARSMISSLEVVISMYRADTGAYPPDDDTTPPPTKNTPSAILYDRLTNTEYGDDAGTDDITGWRGPYMEFDKKDIVDGEIVDPWKTLYKYDLSPSWGNTNSYNLWSCGPDMTDNSSDGDTNYGDDIYNW